MCGHVSRAENSARRLWDSHERFVEETRVQSASGLHLCLWGRGLFPHGSGPPGSPRLQEGGVWGALPATSTIQRL